MTVTGVVVSNGKNLALRRLFDSSLTVVSEFGIGTGTTTPSASDTGLTTPVAAWSGGNDYKAFVSGYPTFDTVNNEVTIRGYVASTEANGSVLTETGLVNTDGTPILFSHDVHTAISKTSSVEIIYTWVFGITD